MPLIATAKNKAAKGSVAAAFKNEEGAIDLASIMVGIIVIGLIGGVIAATVFAVIPWAQDNAAKMQLDSVAAAQSAYVGLSTDGKVPTFGGTPVTVRYDSTALKSIAETANKATMTAIPTNSTGSTNRYTIGADVTVAQNLFTAPDAKIAIANWGSGTDAHYAAAVKSASGARFYISDTKTQPTAWTADLPVNADTATARANAVINVAVATVN